jgi:hypothetical protein
MKNFIKKMLSASPDVSHKRVIVVLFALSILIFCFIATYTTHVIPEFMFDALCWIVAGGMGLTILDKFTKNKKEQDDQSN